MSEPAPLPGSALPGSPLPGRPLPGSPEARADLGLAAALALATAALAAALFQERFYGDGANLRLAYDLGDGGYHPAHWALWTLLAGAGADLDQALRLASLLPAALAGALLFLALRHLGIARGAAVAACALALLARPALFFATSVEVHALQFCGASAALLAAARLGRGPDLADLGRAALAGLFLAGTHPTNALVLPAVDALYLLRRRERKPASGRGRFLAAAGVALALLAPAVVAASLYQRSSGVPPSYFLGGARWRGVAGFLIEHWALNFGVLTALGALGWAAGLRRRPGEALAIALWILPLAVAVALLDLPERGGYYLGTLPALAWAGARGAELVLARRSRAATGGAAAALGLLVFGQAYSSRMNLAAWDRPLGPAERAWVEDARAETGGRGAFFSHVTARCDLVQGWVGLPATDASRAIHLPPEDVEPAIAIQVDWAEDLVRRGEPVHLDLELVERAGAHPISRRLIERFRERFVLVPAERGAFRARRCELR